MASLLKAAQAAMEIAAGTAEKQAADAGKGRDFPDIGAAEAWRPAGCRLRNGFPSPDRIPAELFHETGDIREIIAVVGVAHDNVVAAGGGDAAHQCAAIAFRGHM